MKKLLKFSLLKIKYIVLIYVAIQIVLIFTQNRTYKSDALYYYTLAEKCIQQNEFYPSTHNLNDDYIVAPLYINVIYLTLKVYNSTVTVSLLNLLITLLQIFVLYQITNKLFSKDTARLTILIYILYLNTLGLVLQNYTELFFLMLVSYSIYFFILQKNIYSVISGIIAGCAIAVRPVGWALLAAFLVIHFISIYKHQKKVFNYFYLYSGIAVFIILFGVFNKFNSGHFEFTSTTGPINLLLGANDDATGGFNSTVLEKGKAGYIEFTDSMTYLQKDKFYWEEAISWISEHPVKWLLLVPMKLLHTFGWDDISLSSLLGMSDVNFARAIKIILLENDFDKAMSNTSTIYKVFYLSILILHHLFYFFLLFAMFAGVYRYLKIKKYNENINLILFFCMIILFMIMLTVGAPRYKYPMFILQLPFAASYIESKFNFSVQSDE